MPSNSHLAVQEHIHSEVMREGKNDVAESPKWVLETVYLAYVAERICKQGVLQDEGGIGGT